jgi:hypothetical protein
VLELLGFEISCGILFPAAGQLHQNFRPLKIKQLRNAASSLSVLIFETVFATY